MKFKVGDFVCFKKAPLKHLKLEVVGYFSLEMPFVKFPNGSTQWYHEDSFTLLMNPNNILKEIL